MILGEKFVISTPTKVATESLMRLAKDYPSLLRYEPPKHSRFAPEGYIQRIMIVRDPYDRMESAYKWLSRRKWWDEMNGLEFTDYLIFIRQLRRNNLLYLYDPRCQSQNNKMWDWIFNQTDFFDVYQPTKTVRLEDGWDWLWDLLGVELEMPHINKATSSEIEWTAKDIKLVDDCWASDDCFAFGYKRRMVYES